jgi:hypothetical protein
VLCGCPDLEKLTAVTPKWLAARLGTDLFELHHPVGKQHDPNLVVPLCMNCHRFATESLARAGVSMRPIREPQELVAVMLEALAAFFELLVTSLRQWAQYLRNSITREVAHE